MLSQTHAAQQQLSRWWAGTTDLIAYTNVCISYRCLIVVGILRAKNSAPWQRMMRQDVQDVAGCAGCRRWGCLQFYSVIFFPILMGSFPPPPMWRIFEAETLRSLVELVDSLPDVVVRTWTLNGTRWGVAHNHGYAWPSTVQLLKLYARTVMIPERNSLSCIESVLTPNIPCMSCNMHFHAYIFSGIYISLYLYLYLYIYIYISTAETECSPDTKHQSLAQLQPQGEEIAAMAFQARPEKNLADLEQLFESQQVLRALFGSFFWSKHFSWVQSQF